ncbi:MAG: hypothetical protein ACYTHJ_15720 [Planctomycetota bacterium]
MAISKSATLFLILAVEVAVCLAQDVPSHKEEVEDPYAPPAPTTRTRQESRVPPDGAGHARPGQAIMGTGTVIYSNTGAVILFPPGTGVLIADDLQTSTADGNCQLLSYELLVGGGGAGTGPGFTLEVALYDGCPGAGGDVISGTERVIELPDDGDHLVAVDLRGLGVTIPPTAWLGTTFSTDSAGWYTGSMAETGFTADLYHFPTFPCIAQFGPSLYAGFHARIESSDECAQFAYVQVNVDSEGFNIPNDAGNEPSIAVDPTDHNRITIAWRQFDNVESNFRQAGTAYSHDGGVSWTFPGSLTPGQFRSDPVLDFDADGNFYYSSLTGGFLCDMFRSNDGGVSWSSPVFAFGGDKQWIAIDRTDGMGRGNIYQAWSLFAGCCGRMTFNRSTDGGLSFEDAFEIPLSPRWGTLSVGVDGELYVVGVAGSSIVITRSSNIQDADATPVFELSSFIDLGGAPAIGGDPNPAGLIGQVWVATDHSAGATQGNVYVLSTVDPAGNDPSDIIFARSTDGGATWSEPVRVNDDPADPDAWQWFGTMSVAPNGRIDVVFNDTRASAAPNFSQLYYSSSFDAGQTWSPNRLMSQTFDTHVGWPNQNKMGDYYDMVSFNDGAYLTFAATFNNEQDVYFLKITPDCNANDVNDLDDIEQGDSVDCDGNLIPDECEADCNGSMQPDLCDIATGLSEDCNINAIPDECDIDSGTSQDVDSNGVPDECESLAAAPPLAEDSGPCVSDADCETTATCIEGACYAPKNRYISVRANVSNDGVPTARRVSIDTSTAGTVTLGWVGEADELATSALAEVPHFADWNLDAPVVHVGDCDISPQQQYRVQAIAEGADILNESDYSTPRTIPTTATWGDVVGDFTEGAWLPPDDVGNFVDVLAVVSGFQGADNRAPLPWLDVSSQVPDRVVNFADIQLALQGGFQNQPYPFPATGNCP